jgi:rubrerythrin
MGITVVEALHQALESEITGFTTYLEFARETEDITGKNMFITLAREEVDHFDILRKQLKQALDKNKVTAHKITHNTVSQLVPRLDPVSERTRGREGTDMLGAIETAMDQERAAIEFYSVQAKDCTDEQVRNTFEQLVEMETAHFELLQAQLDYINGTGHWFGVREWTMEG